MTIDSQSRCSTLKCPSGVKTGERATNVLQPERGRNFPRYFQGFFVFQTKTTFLDLLPNLHAGRESHVPIGVRESDLAARYVISNQQTAGVRPQAS